MSSVALSVVNSITATVNQTAVGGTINDPIIAIANNPILPGTAGVIVPIGTTAQRPLLGFQGIIRLNTTTGFFECSADGVNWVNLAVGGGGVASVSGTLNRITSTGGVNPVIDIAATYVGQASITTLGTVTTGTWNATTIALNHGGTNAALVADNGALVYSTAGALALLASTATANQIPLSGSHAAPSWSTATYPSTTTINRLLYSSAANTITDLATVNSAVLVTTSAGVPGFTGTMTNGQVVIGSTGATPTAANLSAGAGISITNGAGSITITNTSAGASWVDAVATPVNMVANTSYIADAGALMTFNIPAIAAQGSQFEIAGTNGGNYIIQMNAGQTCHFASQATTVAGTLTATNQYDCIKILCVTANTTFVVVTAIGTFTPA